MIQVTDPFYDDMAAAYHLIFDDWNTAIERQQRVLSRLLPPPAAGGTVLDCACGIGTQALGLARAGYAVEGTDLSQAAIERAWTEAAARQLDISFRVDDMRQLGTCPLGGYGVVLAFDNALPHLDSDEDLLVALGAMRDRLRPRGTLLLSLRDYGPLMQERPTMTSPSLFWDGQRRRIVHQVWDWEDSRRYIVHLFITREVQAGRWATNHFQGRYRAVSPREIAGFAEQAGFQQVESLEPKETGYYQPIVAATRP
jgi:SAM-dependent methyltransferase